MKREKLFTKGPWVILPEEADKDYIRIRGSVPGGRYKVCNVPTPTYEGVHERELAETRANANLIASAPCLLEALEETLEYASAHVTFSGVGKTKLEKVVIAAKQAISKAYGEPS